MLLEPEGVNQGTLTIKLVQLHYCPNLGSWLDQQLTRLYLGNHLEFWVSTEMGDSPLSESNGPKGRTTLFGLEVQLSQTTDRKKGVKWQIISLLT
jgi:hypothetical protein